MNERTALITGASSGIGRALAERLASRGTTVALCARRVDALDDLRRQIEANGGKAVVYAADLSHPEAAVDVAERADDALGGLDLVVANAAVGSPRNAKKLTWEAVAPVLLTNVLGALATLTAVLPRMVERNRGHLVGISSIAAYRGFPSSAAYSASKAALSTFLDGLRVDLLGTSVHVTDVRPGFIDTAMSQHVPSRPFLLTVNQCVDRIVRAIDRREAMAAFPAPLAIAASMTRFLPGPLYDALIVRATDKIGLDE